jgi:hypothetical protein
MTGIQSPTSERALYWIERALWWSAWVSVGAALLLSLGPGGGAEPSSIMDKLAHVGGYGAMSVCFLLAAVWLPGRGGGRLPNGSGWILAAILAFSLVVEIAQGFVGRSTDPLDGVANALGVGIAWLAWRAARRRASG